MDKEGERSSSFVYYQLVCPYKFRRKESQVLDDRCEVMYLCDRNKNRGKMKKLTLFTMMVAMMALMTACSKDDDLIPEINNQGQTRGAAGTKTVVIYLAGRNDLTAALNSDFEEIKAGSRLIGEDMNLLVFMRRYPAAEQPWLARICNGEVRDSVGLSEMGIQSSDGQQRACDPEVMEGVLRYAFSHYPASDGYGLVLGGHATGWLIENEVQRPTNRAFGVDYGRYAHSSDGRYINITTMADVLSRLPHLRFIMADCCNFMCLENLYELRHVTDYIIGSPAEIPGFGAPYDEIMPDLFADGPFYTNIIDKYYASVNGFLPLTAIRTDAMEHMAEATRQALKTLPAFNDGSYPDMNGLIHYYYTFPGYKFHREYNIFYDAGDFLRTYIPEDSYQQWLQALDEMILETRMATCWETDKVWRFMYTDFTVTEEKFHGVSMFVPQNPELGDYAKYNEDIKQMEWYKAAGMAEIGW